LGLVAETHRKATDLHLVFDLQDQIAATPELTAAAIRPALRALPQALDWLSVTVAGTGMPTGTAEIGADGQANIPRVEWQLWRLLTDPETRRVSFGDYCVQHPNPLSDFNPLFMDSSAQLRYTIPDSWFVARGRGVRARGAEQIHQLAGLVVSHADFSGADFSCGDNWLARCAARECGAGNQGVWRKVTTSHHLTYVVRQIANHFGS
jgi:hypothetical protein